MPQFPHASRPLVAALLLACGALVGTARAADHGHAAGAVSPASAPASASAAAPVAAAASSAEAPRKAARAVAESAEATPPPVRGPRDPMDILRERLAQKLGGVKTPDPGNPNLVRVVGKPTLASGPEVEVAAPVHRAPRRKAVEAVAPAEATHAAQWDYTGSGSPATWARLDPEFSKCATGTRQSPIDIRDGIKVELDPVEFNYQPSAFRVIDNGHTVQVNVARGNWIEVMGKRYELVQFHFHRPSEERVDGKQFDMVVHLVHRDPEGHQATVAVLLEKGSAQGVIQSVWNNLPLEKGDEVAARGTLNLNDLLPTRRDYYTYMGSMTTPPCSEGVLWMVMKQPVAVSTAQIDIFARLYPMNARPVQPLAGRLIKESN